MKWFFSSDPIARLRDSIKIKIFQSLVEISKIFFYMVKKKLTALFDLNMNLKKKDVLISISVVPS